MTFFWKKSFYFKLYFTKNRLKSFLKPEYNSKEKNKNNREICKDDEDSEEIVKLKESGCSKQKEIENL